MGTTFTSRRSGIAPVATQKVSRRNRVILASVLALPALAPVAQAANQYWDINGANTGATDDTGNTASGNWDTSTSNWTTVSGGTVATGLWVPGNTAIFSAGTNASAASGINVVGTQSAAGITIEEGTITFGGGEIALTAPTINTATATTIGSVISGSVGLTKSGASTLTLNGANTYTGPTSVTAGTLTVIGSNASAGTTTVSGGTLIAVADNAFGAVPGSPTDNVFNAATIRGNASFTLDANRTVVIGPVAGTGSGTGTFDVTTGNTFTIAGNVKANGTSTAALSKTGAGTLVLSGNLTHTNGTSVTAGTLLITGNASYGGTTTVNGGSMTLSGSNALTGATSVSNGTLTLDYTVNNNDKINSAGLLTINHLGVVTLTGSDAGSTTQTVNGLTTGASGVATLNVNQGSGQNITMNLGTVTRGTASVLNITAAAGSGTTTITTTNAGTNGILGGYATFGNDTWAAVSGGSITPLSAYDTDDYSAATKNTDVTTDATPGSAVSVNSLRFNASHNVTLTGANTITTGGVLIGPSGGGSINGGTLTSGAADLVVHQNSGADFTVGSAVAGSIGLTKAGTGTLVLSGANTNTGTYTVISGTLKLGASDVVTDTSPIVVSTGGTFDLNGNNDTVGNLTGFGTIAVNGNLTTGGNTAAATFSGPFTGGGTVTKIGTGTQTLSGNSSGFSGPINVNNGVLVASAANALGAASASTTVATGAALQVTGAVNIPEPLAVSGTGISNTGVVRKTATTATTLSGGITLGADSRVNSDAGTLVLATADINNAGFNLTLGGAGNMSFTAKITGTGQLIKDGTGTVTFGNNNSNYTGKTVINAGNITYNGQVGTGVGPLGPNPTGGIVPDFITLNGGTLTNASVGSGGTALDANKGITLGANGGTWSFTDAAANIHIYRAPITGPGGFTKAGIGTLGITGNSNFNGTHTYAGPTTIAGGILRLRQEGTTPNFFNGALPATTALTINTGGTFDMAFLPQTIDSLAGSGALVANSSASTLTISGGNASPVTFSGTLTNTATTPGATNLKLTKNGTGTQILSGANQNTGAIAVNGGVLQFNTAGSLGGTGANVTAAAAGTVATGYAMDQAFLGRIVTSSAGVAALAANSSNNLDMSAFGTLRLGAVGTATLSGTITPNGGTYRLGGGGGTLKLANAITDGNNMDVGNNGTSGGTVALTGTNKFGTLAVSGAKLDVANGKLVLTATSTSTLRGLLQTGRHDVAGVGQWNGDGVITSNGAADANKVTAIGYLTADDKGLTGGSWDTISGLSATDVITKYTYYGDINLDGKVNADDYTLMDRGLAKYTSGVISAGTAVWLNGDLNYDGTVSAADFLLADTAFGHQTGVLSPAFLAEREAQFGSEYVTQLVAAVPEPTSLGLVAAGAVGLVGRRRRGR